MKNKSKNYPKKGQKFIAFSEETIEEARRIDLLSYLKTYEPQELLRCGNNIYCTREHDSLKLSNGKWFWWSRGIGGTSALDFLIKVRGIPFRKAILMLTKKRIEVSPFSLQKEREETKEMVLPPHNFECQTVKKYLENRKIDTEIVDFFICKKMIAEDNQNHYAMFFGDDENGKHRQCSVRATDGKMFKKEVSGSDKQYSFHLDSESCCEELHVFECAIDLMSYATLLKLYGRDFKNKNLLSLSGVYMPNSVLENTKVPLALKRYLSAHPNIRTIYLNLDSDRARQEASKGLIAVLKDK